MKTNTRRIEHDKLFQININITTSNSWWENLQPTSFLPQPHAQSSIVALVRSEIYKAKRRAGLSARPLVSRHTQSQPLVWKWIHLGLLKVRKRIKRDTGRVYKQPVMRMVPVATLGLFVDYFVLTQGRKERVPSHRLGWLSFWASKLWESVR